MSLLEMKGISKAFGPVKVLQGVDLHLESGEVLALLGENGAGKSTLMKILTGVYSSDDGQVLVDGKSVDIHQIQDSRALGIEIIHQELSLFRNLSIAENFLIGHEAAYRKPLGLVDFKKLDRDVVEALKRVGLNRPPSTLIGDMGVGEQQLVEIARAAQSKVRFLVMDEPTAALTEVETARLFELIRQLRADGVGIVYISHQMEELYQIADKVEILRDGKFIGTRLMAEAEALSGVSFCAYGDVMEAVAKAIRVFLDAGAEAAIVTLGSEGSVYGTRVGATNGVSVGSMRAGQEIVTRDGLLLLRQSAYAVKVVDTTAAGDTFVGSFAALHASTENIAWSVQYASAAAALAVTKPGAQTSVPTNENVLAFLDGQGS